MKNKLALLLAICVLPAFYLFIQYSGVMNKVQLTSKTWHSDIHLAVSEDSFQKGVDILDNVTEMSVISDIRYLVDKSFIQESMVRAFDKSGDMVFTVNMSNVGSWKYDQDYLFLDAGNIRDLSTIGGKYIESGNVERFKEIFLLYMLQAKRVNVIDEHTILMTGVDNSSQLWVSRD